MFYDAERRREGPLALALRFRPDSTFETHRPPPRAPLPPTKWRIPRETRSDGGLARVKRVFEDTPFYARALVEHRIAGEDVESIHESLSLDRFANPLVRLMLPFRMPRRAGSTRPAR